MNIRKTLLSGVFATSIALGGASALAQVSSPTVDDATAMGTPVTENLKLEQLPIVDAQGNVVAHVDVWEDENGEGVWFSIANSGDSGLAEGKYGVHIHDVGVCDSDTAFEGAGGHYNPTGEMHGDINADPSHAGDLGNLEVDTDGNFEHEVLAEKLSLKSDEPNSLADANGSAIVIHAAEDDLETDPSGDSDGRWACGVIVADPASMGTPAASPVTDPVATPAS